MALESQSALKEKNKWGARIILPIDMPDDMLEDAVMTAKKAITQYDIEVDGFHIAEFIKKSFDEKWEPF